MAQKDKVKELVGRGLDSYHAKALQQMDRIEKKNKEQNHKISILSNELDNDYLTKTEEGSVISLEHSKEGMVYLDELQGNTLVNYCIDGSKELTLNGDIDLEGTFVTTTEGVDNGLIDVMCEGNTLVNLLPNKELKITCNNDWDNFYAIGRPNATSNITFGNTIQDVKPNTTYTLIYNVVTRPTSNHYLINNVNASTVFDTYVRVYSDTPLGINKVVLTTLPDLTDKTVVLRQQNGTGRGEVYIKDYMLLEGDWTNKEIPPYFEGMKSVGQDDENGHKIEILSTTKNLFSTWKQGNILENGTEDTSEENVKSDFISVLPNTKYICSNDGVKRATHFVFYDKDKQHIGSTSRNKPSEKCTTPYNCRFVRLTGASNLRDKTQFEIGETITPYNSTSSLNKKEILLNEPLRALPNGVKDRIVKIGSKSYIERNCGEITLTELLEGITHNVGVGNQTSTMVFAIDRIINNLNYKQLVKNGVCDRFSNNTVVDVDKELIYFGQNINIRIDKTKLTSQDTEGFKQWLRNNPTKIVYQLETPIYEPLEIEPTLNTYNDITHISNNSIIPCNMKIQNSGYNAIIKPSTLYTVALDTNKSGTIGMNLGGVKGTTTNNVLTLTTPATLTDDSLRLYGKGIKGSKVRLLEGDKTNWIPSHFEGMKSCFEDKVQSDGSYKMEFLMNNRNLFSTKDISYKGAGTNGRIDILTDELIQFTNTEKTYTQAFMVLRLKPFTTYKLSAELQLMQIHVFYGRVSGWNANKYFADINNLNSSNLILKTKEFTTDKSGIITLRITNEQKIGINIAKNIIVEEIDGSDYVPHKQNKIQFSSIEPLRKLDKFVFKDNMLMVERNNAEKVLNGTENWSYDTSSSTQEVGRFGLHNEGMKGNRSLVICDKYAFKTNYTMTSHNYEGTFTSIGGNTLYLDTMLNKLETKDLNGFKKWLSKNPVKVVYELVEPVYEEIPFELQKIILEGYENGTLFIDTNIPPTVTTIYAGETPIVKSVRLNKTEVLNNTTDINDNIIPYLMDMDYRVVCLELATETQGISMARLFGGTYEMLQRDILSNRYSIDEYKHRLDVYLGANKITEEEYNKLGDMLNE